MFKKSFSLVEAAIYLMLVGVLTTAVIGGAALVEKAKIQKVIEDIDYYEKAFVQFTIQFGQVPGNITLKKCEQNIDVFKNCQLKVEKTLSEGDTICDGASAPYRTEWCNFAMKHLQLAGLINTLSYDATEGFKPITTYNGDQTMSRYDSTEYLFSHEYLNRVGGKVNYSNNGKARFYSCSCFDDSQQEKTCNISRGSGKDLEVVGQFHSTYKNSRDYQYLRYNILLFENNTDAKYDSNLGAGIGAVGLFKTKVLEKIDKKIDTGLPRTGKLQALKVGDGGKHKANELCYNKTHDQAETKNDPAKYLEKSTCNLMYFVTDTSGYIGVN